LILVVLSTNVTTNIIALITVSLIALIPYAASIPSSAENRFLLFLNEHLKDGLF